MKKLLLAAVATLAVSSAHAAPYVSAQCKVASENTQNLVTQLKVHRYAKPSPADRSATSVWLHQGYALGMQEVLEVDQMILNCPLVPGIDLVAVNEASTVELQRLQRRINAYDAAQ
jgi:hypothetical protein